LHGELTVLPGFPSWLKGEGEGREEERRAGREG